MRPHNYLITGGCGFSGTALIKHLTANNLGNYIRVLNNLTVGTKADLGENGEKVSDPFLLMAAYFSITQEPLM